MFYIYGKTSLDMRKIISFISNFFIRLFMPKAKLENSLNNEISSFEKSHNAVLKISYAVNDIGKESSIDFTIYFNDKSRVLLKLFPKDNIIVRNLTISKG